MKKIYFIFNLSLIFFLAGCFIFPGSSDKSNEENNNPDSVDVEKENTIVRILNNSHFDIDLYSEPERDISYYLGSVKKNESLSLPANESVAGTVYYIIYHIDIGIDLPWYNKDSFVLVSPEKNKTVDVKVSDPEKMETFDSFVLLENNTGDSVIFARGKTSEFIPENNKKSSVVLDSELAIYKIPSSNFLNLDSFLIKKKNEEIPLKSVISSFDEGCIYTVTLNENGASLKAITPFDINIRKKIWSKDNSLFTTDYDIVMRLGYDKKNTLIIGTSSLDETKIGLARLNEFGEYTTQNDNFVAFTENKNLTSTEIIDFIEQKDGSIVMLCRQSFTTDDYYNSENFVFICYDFSSKSIKWSKVIPSDAPLADGSFYALTFRKDSKNKLVQIGDNKFVCVGIYNKIKFNETETDFDYNILKYMIIYIDGNDINENNVVKASGLKIILSSDSINHAAFLERNLTSAFFDGSDLYICGCDNWDSLNYKSTHVGKIWKISPAELDASDGTFDFSAASNIVYSCNNCLFFSMDGSGSDYVVCGEYTDNGKLLKGCYVTSGMIKSDSSCKPVLYTVKGKNYCWFNQLCQYGNKMVFCGKSSDEMDGSKSPLPFVVAFDYKGNKLWENLTYTSYTDALNILPNTIGTYTLQLSRGKNFRSKIHYVNADLLGNEVK